MFQAAFIETIGKFTHENDQVKKLWNNLFERYSSRSRHYHTLNHLDHMHRELKPVQNNILDWDVVIIAIAYHDIIYNVLKKDNEERSAAYVQKHLSGLLTKERLGTLQQMILATKNHTASENPDTNYFTDADLSILGSGWDNYFSYTKQIRKEYGLYPDIIYKPGRRNVVKHFLEMDKIFKTPHFFDKYEIEARKNLKQEYSLLTSNE